MERRRLYRVRMQEPERMRLVLETADGVRFQGQLFDLSLHGAGASFEGEGSCHAQSG